MAKRREVTIPIGKRTYDMQTELDEDTLARVVKIVNDAYDSMSGSGDQARVFMLVCLQLAYHLERISGLLEPLEKKLDALKFTQTVSNMQNEKERG